MAEPVGLGIKTPDTFQTLGNLLNFANTAQNIQRGNIDLQQNQIKLQERQAIQNLFSNPTQFKTPDGMTDFDKLIELGIKAAPTTFPAMVPQIIQAKKEGVLAQQAFNNLDKEQRGAVGQFMGSMVGDDYGTVVKKLDALGNANPQLKPYIDFARKHQIDKAGDAKDQKALDAATQKVAQWALSVPEQITANTPSGQMVTNNAQSGFLNIKPSAGPTGIVPGSQINMQLPLGERQRVEMNPVTQSPMTVAKDAFGNVQGVTQTPTGPGVPQLAPGQPQDIPIVTQERAAINQAASQVPAQRFNNQQIIQLSSSNGFNTSGPGAQTWARIAGAVGSPWGSDYATNFYELGHHLAMNAQANAKAMGAGTDAAREVSGLVSGDRTMTPDALIRIAKVNDAMATGLEAMNQGMERAIQASGGNILAARQFKNDWAKSFDPNAMRILNAAKSGDKKEIDSIVKELGGKDGKGMQELRRKVQALDSLVTKGSL